MDAKSLLILGRQPALGRAELESLFGADKLTPVGDHAMACSLPHEKVPFARLGGSVRLARPIEVLKTTQWREIASYLTQAMPSLLGSLPEGKVKLGLSAFDLHVRAQQLTATGLELKKTCRKEGRSARVVPNVELELSSAQVLHNQLVGEVGMELLLIRDGNKTHVAQTVKIQDIEAYAKRDQGRPKRDARVGMLPPKLAQIIINIAAAKTPSEKNNVALDPFCGTGVVLQEALLMGYGAYGTDLEPRMIDYSKQNIDWLEHGQFTADSMLEVGDATSFEWQHPFSFIATETYLGRGLSAWPSPTALHEIMGTCNAIIEKFLHNLSTQMTPGQRLCVAVPAWRNPNGQLHHLQLLDHIDEIGYNRQIFEYATKEDLVYFRSNQIVARELLVITRK